VGGWGSGHSEFQLCHASECPSLGEGWWELCGQPGTFVKHATEMSPSVRWHAAWSSSSLLPSSLQPLLITMQHSHQVCVTVNPLIKSGWWGGHLLSQYCRVSVRSYRWVFLTRKTI
jgi:hypothetical protein